MEMLKILFLYLICCFAQWTQMGDNGAQQIDTGPHARPPPSVNGAMWCLDDDSQYILNGVNQLWKYEIKDRRWLWQPNPPDTLNARTYAASWIIKGKFYLYGGLNQDERALDDMWIYDPQTRQFTQELQNHLSCYGGTHWTHEASNRLFLWGGYCNGTINNNLYAYDIDAKRWSHITAAVSGPNGSMLPSSVVGRNDDMVFIYASNDELWELDLLTFEWTKTPPGGPSGPNRYGAVLWRSSKDDSILLYGGIAGSKIYGDTWIFSPDTKLWTFLGNTGPSPRHEMSHCLTTFGYMYMFGGEGEYATNDIWQYGPYTVDSVFDMIENKLGSATLMATWAFVTSLVTLILIVIILILYCIRRCIDRKKNSFVINTSKRNYVIDDENEGVL